jgi:hypothetical protein
MRFISVTPFPYFILKRILWRLPDNDLQPWLRENHREKTGLQEN